MANKLQVANIATKEVVEISNGVIRNGVAYYLSKSEPKAKWCEKYHVKVIGHEEAGAYTKYLLDTEDGWNFIVPVKGAGDSKQESKARAPRKETPKAAKSEASNDSAHGTWMRAKGFDQNTIFLVRSEFDGNYYTFNDDASIVSDATGIDVNVNGSISFPADMLKKVMSKIVKKGYSVEVVDDEYKGDAPKSSDGDNSNGNNESTEKTESKSESNGNESTEGEPTESEGESGGEPMPAAPKAPAKGASKKGVEKAEKEAAKAAQKAEKEAAKAAEKEAKQREKEKEKAEQAKRKAAQTVGSSVAGTVGREVGKTVGSSFGKFGKTLGGNLGASLGRGVFSTIFKK